MNLRLFDKVYYKKDKKGKKLIYLGKVALLNAYNIRGYTLLYDYSDGWTLDDYSMESVIKQLKKNNTYFKDAKYYLVNIEDNIFVIKHGATFIKNE